MTKQGNSPRYKKKFILIEVNTTMTNANLEAYAKTTFAIPACTVEQVFVNAAQVKPQRHYRGVR